MIINETSPVSVIHRHALRWRCQLALGNGVVPARRKKKWWLRPSLTINSPGLLRTTQMTRLAYYSALKSSSGARRRAWNSGIRWKHLGSEHATVPRAKWCQITQLRSSAPLRPSVDDHPFPQKVRPLVEKNHKSGLSFCTFSGKSGNLFFRKVVFHNFLSFEKKCPWIFD